MAAINTITTTTELANPMQLGAGDGAFGVFLAALSHRCQGAVRGPLFLVALWVPVCETVGAVMPPRGPCVSPVSVWMVWDACGAPGVQCVGLGSPLGPPSHPVRPAGGGRGGQRCWCVRLHVVLVVLSCIGL